MHSMDSQVQDIKDKLNIVDVVSQYMQLRRAGRTYVGRCPFHKERTPSFHVSPERGTYKCFGCGEGGDIFSFVEKMDSVDFKTALEQLAERAGVTLERKAPRPPEEKEKEERLYDACEEACSFFQTKLAERKEITEYLHNRGVHDETILSWRLGYAPASWEDLTKHLLMKGFTRDDLLQSGLAARSEAKASRGSSPDVSSEETFRVYDRFRGRIMFPIFDAGGKVIAFSGRFFEKVSGSRDEDEPAKYVNSAETALFKKSKVLYGFDRAKNTIRKVDCVLLVEGQFDVVLSHQSGLPFTVAISGTALTPEHLSLLGRISKRLVLALDADAAGLRSGLKSAQMALAMGFDVKVPAFPEGKDPADIAKENPELLKAAIRTSQTAVEFFLTALRPQAKDERDYKKLVEAQVLPLIASMQSKIEQAHFVSLVAQRLGVPESAVRVEVERKTKPQSQTEESGTPTPATFTPLSSFDRTIGMLLFHFESDTAWQEKLESLVGKERVALVREKLMADAERLRFEFDSLGEDAEESAKSLMVALERGLVEEQIERVKVELRGAGGSEEGALAQKLSTLKRRQQELRI